jgi:hypothetical protein
MDLLFFPEKAIPLIGTQPRQYFDLILQGPVTELDAMIMFKGNQRSPIQALRGDDYGHWMLNSILDEKGRIYSRELDWRHLSGDQILDAQARRERRKQLKEISAKEAKQGRVREAKAIQEREEAQAEYFKSLGDAANEATFKK